MLERLAANREYQPTPTPVTDVLSAAVPVSPAASPIPSPRSSSPPSRPIASAPSSSQGGRGRSDQRVESSNEVKRAPEQRPTRLEISQSRLPVHSRLSEPIVPFRWAKRGQEGVHFALSPEFMGEERHPAGRPPLSKREKRALGRPAYPSNSSQSSSNEPPAKRPILTVSRETLDRPTISIPW